MLSLFQKIHSADLVTEVTQGSSYELSLSRPVALFDLQSLKFKLRANEIHLWQAKLDDRLIERLEPILSEDERARAHRFRFEEDRDRFIVARGLLRMILGSYLSADPSELEFSYGEKGKPALKSPNKGGWISFNLAHSHEMAIYAVSRNRPLGVDLEFIKDGLADQAVAERFFSVNEVAALNALPAATRKESFFNCWTRKEAYIKARGEGLSIPLDKFDVSLAPGDPAALLKNDRDPEEVSRWSMQAVTTKTGYVAALVAEGHDWTLKHFELQARSLA